MSPLKVKEDTFKDQVTGLAEILGWKWVHWRPLLTRKHGWQTPYDGPMGKGWPDLTLVRSKDGRLLLVELKSEEGKVEEWQQTLLAWLTVALVRDDNRIGVYLWRPSDWDTIVEVLT